MYIQKKLKKKEKKKEREYNLNLYMFVIVTFFLIVSCIYMGYTLVNIKLNV